MSDNEKPNATRRMLPGSSDSRSGVWAPSGHSGWLTTALASLAFDEQAWEPFTVPRRRAK